MGTWLTSLKKEERYSIFILQKSGNMGEGVVENSKITGDIIYGRPLSVCETKFSIRWGHLSSSAQVAGIGHDLHALNRKLNAA